MENDSHKVIRNVLVFSLIWARCFEAQLADRWLSVRDPQILDHFGMTRGEMTGDEPIRCVDSEIAMSQCNRWAQKTQKEDRGKNLHLVWCPWGDCE